MKKIIISLALFLSIPSIAMAKSGYYLGVNANHSHAKHRIEGVSRNSNGYDFALYGNRTRTDKKEIGFGFEGGYKFELANAMFVAPEIFFDSLNNSSEDPSANDRESYVYKQDRISIDNRYGARLNLGYNFTQNLNAFVSAGVTNIDYQVNWNSQIGTKFSSFSSNKIAPIYGFGLAYNLNDNWAVKGAYDRQAFNIRYNLDGWRSNVVLETFRLGLGYNF